MLTASAPATDFQEYSLWPPPPERKHFLSYLQVVDRPKEIPATVYTGTLGLAGKSAWTAYDTFAKEKTKEVRVAFNPAARFLRGQG